MLISGHWLLLGLLATSPLALTACKKASASEHPDAGDSGAGGDKVQAVDPADDAGLNALLEGEGLLGWMHGSVPEMGLFVFTYRHPDDFFRYADFPCIPATPEVAKDLAARSRHDKVRMFGKIELKGPQRHIVVQRVELSKAWEPTVTAPPYEHDSTLPPQLLSGTTLVGRVHAMDANGRVLVVELGDLVVPILVDSPELAKDLFRNYKIRLHYTVATSPNRPAHLRLDTSHATPIEVIDRIVAGHGQPIELEGELVLFPKSPQLTLDIWALRIVDADRVEREYTLVNFEDAKEFEAIRAKLAQGWAASNATPISVRNKLLKPGVRVHAKGILNVISPSQANPQILLDSANSVDVMTK